MVTVALRGFKRDVTPAPTTTTAKTPLRPARRCSQNSFNVALLLKETSVPLRSPRDRAGARLRARRTQKAPDCHWPRLTVTLFVRECITIFVQYFRQ